MNINPIQLNNSYQQSSFKGTIDRHFNHYIMTAKKNKLAASSDLTVAQINDIKFRFADIEDQIKGFMSKIMDNISLTFEIYHGKSGPDVVPAFVDKEKQTILFAGTKTFSLFRKGKVDDKKGCLNLPKTCAYWHRPYEKDMNLEDLAKWTENLVNNVNPEDVNEAFRQNNVKKYVARER